MVGGRRRGEGGRRRQHSVSVASREGPLGAETGLFPGTHPQRWAHEHMGGGPETWSGEKDIKSHVIVT